MSTTLVGKTLSYEDILISNIGGFGKAQLLVLFTSLSIQFFCAWSMLMMGFAGMEPQWWSVNIQYNKTSNISKVIEMYQKCPGVNGTVRYAQDVQTIVSEWNLICDKTWIPTLITTLQMVGVLCGGFACSHLGDWLGRRKTLILFFGANLLFSIIEGFSVNWQMMAVCRFIVGNGIGGSITLYSIYILEFISKKWRTFVTYFPAWALGVICFGALFKLLPNWRHICIANGSIGLVSFLALLLSPESIRWLLIKGRVTEAKGIVKKLARINGLTCNNLEDFDHCGDIEEKKIPYTYIDLMKFKETRYKALIMAFITMYFNFAYYGLTLGVSQLDGDATNNMMIMGACDVGKVLVMAIVTKWLARKKTTIFFVAGATITSFIITITYFTKTLTPPMTNGFALTSRFMVTSAWAVQLLFCLELFPTEIRTLAYGFTSFAGRIGGILAPQNKTLNDVSLHLPFTVNGVLGLISCILLFFLKDTYHKELTDLLKRTTKKSQGYTTTL